MGTAEAKSAKAILQLGCAQKVIEELAACEKAALRP